MIINRTRAIQRITQDSIGPRRKVVTRTTTTMRSRSPLHSGLLVLIVVTAAITACEAYYHSMSTMFGVPAQYDYRNQRSPVRRRTADPVRTKERSRQLAEMYLDFSNLLTKYGTNTFDEDTCSAKDLDDIDMGPGNVSDVARTCFVYPVTLFPAWIDRATIFGKCPSKLSVRTLPTGSIPPVMPRVSCQCPNKACSDLRGECTVVSQQVPYWKAECGQNLTMSHIKIDVGCWCLRRDAPLGYNPSVITTNS